MFLFFQLSVTPHCDFGNVCGFGLLVAVLCVIVSFLNASPLALLRAFPGWEGWREVLDWMIGYGDKLPSKENHLP